MGTTQATPSAGREFISLTDVSQFEEEMIIEGYKGEKDANASRETLPHDNYIFSVRYADSWPHSEGETPVPLASDPNARWVKKLAKDGKVLWMTWLQVETRNNADPAHDGYSWTELITTYPTKQGTTATQALLQGLEVDTIMLNTHSSQVRALDEKLAGDGTLVGAEVDWIARYFDKAAIQKDKQGNPVIDSETNQQKTGVEIFRLRGMRRFPKYEDGNHRAMLTHADDSRIPEVNADGQPVEIRAFSEIRRWIPVGKLAQAGAGQDAVAEQPKPVASTQSMPARPVTSAGPSQAAPVQQTAQAPAPTAPRVPARPGVRRV